MSRRKFLPVFVEPAPIGTSEQANKAQYHPRGGKCSFTRTGINHEGREKKERFSCVCGSFELRDHRHRLLKPQVEWNPVNGDGKVMLECWMCGGKWAHEFQQQIPELIAKPETKGEPGDAH